MKFVKLKDLLVETKDGEWGKDEPVNEDDIKVAVIRGADFKNIRVNDFSAVPMKYVPKRKVERKALKEGDILIETAGGTATRPTGRTAIVKRRHLQNGPVLCASFARYMRPNVEMILPDYLYWYLQYLYTIGEMARNQVQHTGVARFQFTQFSNNTYIPVPEFPYQRKVVSILNALDEKIELNNRINKTLEEMAQAIFKSWFVDFEPFRDGEFVESELGMIPKGWDVKSLDEIASFLNGLAMQKYRPTNDEYLPVIKIKELRQGYTTPDSDKATTQLHSDYIVNDGDVLFSWSGTLEVKVWCGGKGALNQHLFKVTSEMYEKWFYYHWTKFHLDRFRRIAKDKATTMGHIRRKDLSESKVFVPDQSTYERINEIMKPIFDQIITLNIQSRKLEKIRNTLLPKLMSGEIRVPLD